LEVIKEKRKKKMDCGRGWHVLGKGKKIIRGGGFGWGGR